MSLIGVIGGSGIYALMDQENIKTKKIDTPFGAPSDEYFIGEIGGEEIVFLPRHGRNHSFLPSEVNYQANIYGMKQLGVDQILSISAVGSLREELKPRDVVIVDQFFDRTNKRPQSFFGGGAVAHVAFGDPVCPSLREKIIKACEDLDAPHHPTGTYVNMEGPQFSTRAESCFYKQLGFDVIGMTNLSEARLAREAEICYASLAFVTDYDCWKVDEEGVTAQAVLQVLKDNSENASRIIKYIISNLNNQPSQCECQKALESGLFTPIQSIPSETIEKLGPLIKKYLK